MKITKENVEAVISAILTDPSCSYWLQNALREALKRDVVEAANDAGLLSMILSARAAKAFEAIR